MNRTAIFLPFEKTSAFLAAVDNSISPNKKTVLCNPRFCEWTPSASEKRSGWAVMEVNPRTGVALVRKFDAATQSAFEPDHVMMPACINCYFLR
jgi:hypothetical protein